MLATRAPAGDATGVLQGFARPPLDPAAQLGSPVHREAVRIALKGGAAQAQFRPRAFDRFHRLKLRVVLRQRHFPSRALNYRTWRLERTRRARVHYLPPAISLEANGSCNLRCPGCVTGLALPAGERKQRASLELMRAVI